MPRGRYLLSDDLGPVGIEVFSCAAGPAGWRYTSTVTADGSLRLGSVDVTVDSRGHQVRVELSYGEWVLRGGVSGREVLWVRAGTERAETGHGLTGRSPGLLVAVARLLGTDTERVLRLVEVSEPALATRVVEQRWVASVTEHAGLPVRRYEIRPLDTGEPREIHLAGDVVVAGDGIELLDLDGPPTL